MSSEMASGDHADTGRNYDEIQAAVKPRSAARFGVENDSAIPTAGGERLGAKHWGESKVVPDQPALRAPEGQHTVSAMQHAPPAAM